jgi:hypothetical protein
VIQRLAQRRQGLRDFAALLQGQRDAGAGAGEQEMVVRVDAGGFDLAQDLQCL